MGKVAIRRDNHSGLVCYAGDSMTAWDGYPHWPEMVAAVVVWPGLTHTNVAIGGYSLTELAVDAVTLVDSLLVGQRRGTHAPWIGTNDIAAPLGTGAEIYALLAAYCAARRLAGWDALIVGTILPRSNAGLPEGFEARRQEFNTLLRADHSFADALMDVAADSRIGDAGDELDTDYYNADRVHLVTGGSAVVAGIAAPLIAALV